MKKKIVAMVMITVMALAAFAGCGSKSTENEGSESRAENESGAVSENNEEHVMRIGLSNDPVTLAPFEAVSPGRNYTLIQLYEKLAVMDDDRNLTGVLASSWEQNGKTYTIKLYDYIKDTSGNPFTADDAIWCLETAMDKGVNSNLLYVDKIEKVDDYTFSISLTDDYVGLFEAICVNTLFCTKASYEASSSGMSVDPVGTGPYKLESCEINSSYTLVKNEDYWQKEELRLVNEQQQNCDKIVYKIIAESAQQVIAIETDEVDYVISDSTAAARFEEGGSDQTEGISVEYVDKSGGQMLYLNNDKNSIFYDNENLRKAVLYGINSQAIVDGVFNGHATVIHTMMEANYPDMSDKWKDADNYDYSVEASKEYLTAAGYEEGELTLRLMMTSSSLNTTIGETIQAYLGMCGINVEILSYEPALYNSYVSEPEQWDMLVDGKGGTDYAATIIRGKLDKNLYGNGTFGFIQDDALQELVEQAIRLETHSTKTVDAVLDYLYEKAYLKGMYVTQDTIIFNSAKIATLCHNVDAKVVPGACTFSWR